MELRGKRVLVTGGTGFVGSHLTESLSGKGAHVYATCISSNTLVSYDFEPNSPLMKKSVAFVDVTDRNALHDFITRKEIEFIFHLAAQPIVTTALHNPHRTFETNVMGTLNVLESARTAPSVKGVIVASSDKTYGRMEGAKYSEGDRLDGDHPYDASKTCVDVLCRTYMRTYNLPVIVTRFGNIYGEGDLNFSRIIPGIMRTAVTGKPLELRSDGTHIRDYLYVIDVVRAYLFLADNFEKAHGNALAYNLGSDDTHSVVDLIRIAGERLGIEIPYTIVNNQKNELQVQSLNYDRIKRLGFENEYRFEKVVSHICQWYRDNIRWIT